MNDLLSETLSARKAGSPHDDDLETGPSVQMTSVGGDKDLTRFFADIEKIKTQMESIRELLAKLQEANEESKGVHRAQAMKALRDRMDADIAQVTKIARTIKSELEQLDNGNIASRRVKGCEEGTPTDRTRTTITNNQRKKLKDLMGEFQALRERMVGEYKETIERRFAITRTPSSLLWTKFIFTFPIVPSIPSFHLPCKILPHYGRLSVPELPLQASVNCGDYLTVNSSPRASFGLPPGQFDRLSTS